MIKSNHMGNVSCQNMERK